MYNAILWLCYFQRLLNYLACQPFDYETEYLMKVIPRKASCALRLYYYYWFDTSNGGLWVLVIIIRPVVSASALIDLFRYIYIEIEIDCSCIM